VSNVIDFVLDYEFDRQWSDKFVPEVCKIVGPLALQPARYERDVKEASDLTGIKGRDIAVAARIRRHGYAVRYPRQFTIRCDRPSGTKTELRKICDGFADWFFYGHASKDEKTITDWMLIDLHRLRAAFIYFPCLLRNPQEPACGTGKNKDGIQFRWFDPLYMPREVRDMVIATTWDMSDLKAAAD